MSISSVSAAWSSRGPQLLSILRIVTAITFMLAGTSKLFEFPVPLPNGFVAHPFSQIWVAGVLEVFGGGLVLIGLCTRPIAFVLSGEMAVAYFQGHFPHSIYPTVNMGVPAVLTCFIWLYISAVGPGPWSVDALRGKA